MHYTTYILSWLGWMQPELLGIGLLLALLDNGLLLGISLRAIKLLMRYTTYILKLAG